MTTDQQTPSLFGDEGHTSETTTRAVEPMMGEVTRGQVRQAFAKLGVSTALEQFAMVTELTGQRIASVTDLTQRQAETLLLMLSRRVEAIGAKSAGTTWADRGEDTWIDKL